MKSNDVKTWQALADSLGITPATLRAWRANRDSPTGKDLEEWTRWRDERLPTQGRDTTEEAATLADLKRALLSERGRKESALAGLRELELKVKSESLIPETESLEWVCKILIPIRRLLDGMGRACAATANPQEPMIAELAIHSHLNDYILPEVCKQIDAAAVELEAKRREAT